MNAERLRRKGGGGRGSRQQRSGPAERCLFSLHIINIKNNIVKNCIYLYFLLVVLLDQSQGVATASIHSFRRQHLHFDVLSAENLDEIVFIITWDHLYFLVLQYP